MDLFRVSSIQLSNGGRFVVDILVQLVPQQIELECGPMPNVMAAKSYIGDTLCEISVIPFPVPRRQVLLTHSAGLLCSNAAIIGERKTWTQSEFCTWQNSVRGQSPRKCTHSVAAQKTAKHRAKFGSPPVSDVAAVTKAGRETVEICWGAPNSPADLNR